MEDYPGNAKVEQQGEEYVISTTSTAEALLEKVQEAFHEWSLEINQQSGLAPLPRRGYELVAKVSLILAAASGTRTTEHVKWAYALVRRDIEDKIMLVNSNSHQDKMEALASAVMVHITKDHGETLGRIKNKCRRHSPEDITKILDRLVKANHAYCKEVTAKNGKKTKKYFAVK